MAILKSNLVKVNADRSVFEKEYKKLKNIVFDIYLENSIKSNAKKHRKKSVGPIYVSAKKAVRSYQRQ